MDSVAIESPTPQTVRAGVNEKQLFKTMQHLFSTSTTVLAELMQNSRRAQASYVAFDIDPVAKSMTVRDDGSGLSDFANLLQLCQSGWDEEITLKDSPFGMGFFSVFFACESVTIRSNGKTLTVSLDDVHNKRALQVKVDNNPVTAGTVIEMAGLSPNLLTDSHRYGAIRHASLTFEAAHQLVGYAAGFPIPVLLNGEELARPYALANLKTERTPIGHVHLSGVHDENPALPAVSAAALFLQGLPIGSVRAAKTVSDSCPIVHLDPAVFTARMPDRAQLYDHEVQLLRVRKEIANVGRRHLAEMKATLEPRAFVKRYYRNCLQYEAAHLLNDVPLLPLAAFESVAQVGYRSDDTWSHCYLMAADPDNEMLSRQDLLAGERKVWLDAPGSTTEAPTAAALLKLMQRMEVLTFSGDLDSGHWLYQLAPRCADLVVTAIPKNAKGSGDYDWNVQSCEVVIVDSVDVAITSKTDPEFGIRHAVVDDWLLLPKSEASIEVGIGIEEMETICYVTAVDGSASHPVRAFSDYSDESDVYREEWEDDAKAKWDSLVSGLLGYSLAEVLTSATGDLVITVSDDHRSQLALTSATDYGIHFKDLADDAFWEAVSASLPSGAADAPTLRAAFYKVALQTEAK